MFKILIIDDDVALLAHLSMELEQAGYEVLRASETRNADLLIDEGRPDLLLLDTDTSQGEGWELLGRAAPQLPVIVISGRGLEEDIIRGLDAGAVDYLPKPFRTGELLARIRARHRTAAPAPAQTPALPATGTTERLPEAMPVRAAPDAEVARPSPRRQLGEGDQDAPVFIPYGEEQRLIRDADLVGGHGPRTEELGQLPLGQRLRAARQHKRITLVQAELESKVRMHYIQAMEEEKFALLPRGPITEELLRTYAAYIGIDTGQAIAEYRDQHYNAPVEPLAALGGAPLARTLPQWVVWLAATFLALLVGFGGIWLIDPGTMTALGGRARELIVPPTATTAMPAPTATTAPSTTAMPTATTAPSATPAPTATPTASPLPTATSQPSPTPPPTATPRRGTRP